MDRMPSFALQFKVEKRVGFPYLTTHTYAECQILKCTCQRKLVWYIDVSFYVGDENIDIKCSYGGYLEYINYNKKHCISSKAHNRYRYTTWKMKIQKLGFKQISVVWEGVVGVKIFCLFWHPCVSCGKPVVSLSLYNRPINGWWRLGGKGQPYLTTPIWKCMSGIGDHRFTFLMDLLPNYTFYTDPTILSIG